MNLTADALQGLWSATLATAVAALVLLALPRLLRRRFGAGAAYAVWWLVPVALIASLLPARVVETAAVGQPATTTLQTLVEPLLQPITTAPATAAMVDHSALWLWIWFAGAVLMALRLWIQQRRFVRGLGEMRPLRDDLWKAQARHGLPALLGILRARIVLPEDFDQRFDARERQLMLAHERRHRSRGDHVANFAVAAARAVFWFNPLVHLAAARFRHDQELACDQAVIAAHPDSRRAYGEAMLKTLMADRQAPLGCHWGFSHPMKERVMQLKSPMPRPWVRRAGIATVAVLMSGAGFAVWSAQPVRYVSPASEGVQSALAAEAQAPLAEGFSPPAPPVPPPPPGNRLAMHAPAAPLPPPSPPVGNHVAPPAPPLPPEPPEPLEAPSPPSPPEPPTPPMPPDELAPMPNSSAMVDASFKPLVKLAPAPRASVAPLRAIDAEPVKPLLKLLPAPKPPKTTSLVPIVSLGFLPASQPDVPGEGC